MHLVDEGLDVLYEPGFISPERASELFRKLLDEAAWHRPNLVIYNRTIPTPRQVAWHSDNGYVYGYSGQEHGHVDLTESMIEIKEMVKERMNATFPGVLLNLYNDGTEYVGPHADDEKDLVDGAPIIAVSLGATRDFVFKHKNGNRYVLPLENGSLVIMSGDTQKVSKHSLPKRLKVKEPRISLTFRQCTRVTN